MIGAITICFFHLHILWGELLNLKSTYPADSNTERVLTFFERLWMVDLFNLIDNAFCWVCWWDCFFNCIKCKLKSYFNWQSISFVSLLQRLNPTTILCCLAFHFFFTRMRFDIPHIVCWLFPWSKMPLKRLLVGQNIVFTGERRLNHSSVVPESNWNKFKARHVKWVVSGTWSKSESFLHKLLSEVAHFDRSLRVQVTACARQ